MGASLLALAKSIYYLLLLVRPALPTVLFFETDIPLAHS